MPDPVVRIRGSRQAQELRWQLAAELGIAPDECDRLALALGLASVRFSKANDDHPVRRLAASWDLDLSYQKASDDDGRGDVHDLSRIDFPTTGYLSCVLFADGPVEKSVEKAEIPMRRALNAGYRHLAALHDRMNRNAHRLVGELCECVAFATDTGVQPADLPTSGPIRVELGRDTITSEPVKWVINREEGQDTSASLRIAGAQGRGKSQGLLGLLHAIASAASATGFILLDHKGDLARGQTGEPFLRSVANLRVIRPPELPLPINPFDLPRGANTDLAAEIFSSTLATFIPQMGGCQQGIVDRALTEAYRVARQANRAGPSLTQARDAVRRQYQEEGRGDDSVTRALDRLADKPIFSPRSEIEVATVFRQRWVIDISELGELRTYVAFILFHFLRQIAQSLPDAPFAPQDRTRSLRGIVAIDEAHNYLTKGKKSQPLAELIRIGRSKGVPVFLSSQSLDDFKSDAAWRELVPNTLLFGHGAPPDTETLQGALRVDARTAKKAATDCVTLDQFVVFTHLHRDSQNIPKRLRVTPLFERVASP